mgnify:CR=1 FL=1
MPLVLTLARMEHSQYSYLNALVAEADGAVVGALVGYDGALLKQLRAPIFPLLEQHLGEAINIEDETEAGEYYLDSVGVKPEFRGMGIGRRLISALCDEAFRQGHERVGLIVEPNNTKAQALYSSAGFRCVGERPFFSHMMWHMQIERNFGSDKFAK